MRAAGAEPRPGSLEDLAGLRAAAAAADGVIHLAFVHDFADFQAAGRTDRRAVAALGEAPAGSGRPFAITSGTGLLPPGRVGTEEDEPGAHSPRGAAEQVALSFVERGVRVSVMRLPLVHRGGRAGTRRRRRRRAPARRAGDRDHRAAGGRALRLAGLLRHARHAGLLRLDPEAGGLEY
ncbi:hypothetical protein HTZ77_31020 [Nonomuraea sp. SMC257]|uniref:NAD-dependent epimerase/dehydratase family protein n=1 Tax=Nonomuraea montanisoli TaxID=2741721 RepID=A0A7Y6ICN2_9ACTN|nr:hypothetical protein [Nonomuraea montanisoli]NUW35819.1 hypothetical protein [Nonomuraea montanisoli]